MTISGALALAFGEFAAEAQRGAAPGLHRSGLFLCGLCGLFLCDLCGLCDEKIKAAAVLFIAEAAEGAEEEEGGEDGEGKGSVGYSSRLFTTRIMPLVSRSLLKLMTRPSFRPVIFR